jgi:hypothetical protein
MNPSHRPLLPEVVLLHFRLLSMQVNSRLPSLVSCWKLSVLLTMLEEMRIFEIAYASI